MDNEKKNDDLTNKTADIPEDIRQTEEDKDPQESKGIFRTKHDKNKKSEGAKISELQSALVTKEEELSKAKKALDECEDKYMRVRAEYDNYRKRASKEKEACYGDAFSDAVSAFLPLIDNIERAAGYANDDSDLSKGVLMMKKQLADVMQKIGVTEIKSDGEQFDPEKHNAIMHDEDDSENENVVIQTLQKGYELKGKVIRHAMVKVLN